MARSFTFRLTSEGLDQFRRELEALGEAGTKAFENLKNASPQLANALERARAAAEKARAQTEQLGRGPGRGLQALAAGADDLSGRLNGLAGRAGIAGTVLSKLGPVGLAAAAGLGALGLAFTATFEAAAQAERESLKLDAVLKATGGTAGLTRREIEALADEIEGATLFDDGQVKEASAALASFRAVSGETFKETIRLATDMAAVFGGDVPSAARTLGRALADPIEGMQALERAGLNLTDAQERLIEKLVKTGDVAGAGRVLLDELAGAVGGAAAAEGSGLAGAAQGVAEDWDNFLEALGKTDAVSAIAAAGLKGLSNALNNLTQIAAGPSIDEQIARVQAAIAKEEAEGPPQRNSRVQFTVPLAVRKAQLDDLLEQKRFQDGLEFLAEQQAEIAKRQAAADADAEKRRKAGAALAAIVNDKATKDAVDQENLRAASAVEADRIIAEQRRKSAEEAKRLAKEQADEERRLTDQRVENSTKIALAEEEAREASRQRGAELIRQSEQSLRALEEEAALAQARLRLAGADERTRSVELRLIEQKNEALARGQPLNEKDIEQRRRLNEQIVDAEIVQRQAEEAAEAARAPFENAIEGIQGAFSSAFENIFSGGVDSFKDLAGEIKSIFLRLAAEVAALLVFKPIVGSVLGSIGLGGLAQGLGVAGGALGAPAGGAGGLLQSLGGLVSTDPLSALTNLGSTLAKTIGTGGLGGFLFGGAPALGPGGLLAGGGVTSSGLAAVAPGLLGTGSAFLANSFLPVIGSALPGLLSGNFKQAAFGGGGALAGAAIGSIIPGVGTALGATLGGVLGNVVGGLFGGGSKPRQQSRTEFTFENGALGLAATKTGGGASADTSRKLAEAALQSITGLVQGLGGTIAGIAPGQNRLRFFGRDPQFFSVVGNVERRFGGNEKGAEKALNDFIVRFLRDGVQRGTIEGLSDTARTVIKNSVATTAEAFAKDLDIAKLFDSLAGDQKPIAEAEAALKALEEQFRALRPEAERLGLSLAKLDAGLVKAKDRLRSEFDETIADAILGLTDPLALALKQLEGEQKKRVDNAKALGANLVEVERLNALERQRVIEQFAAATIDGIKQFIDQALLGSLSTLTPGQQLDFARGRFDAVAAAAVTGDAAARGEFTTVAQQLLETARGFFASSESFAGIFNEVIGIARSLTNVPGFAEGGVTRGGLALVGERGRELVRFGGPARVFDATTTERLLRPVNDNASAAELRQTSAALQGLAARIEERQARAEAAMSQSFESLAREMRLDREERRVRGR